MTYVQICTCFSKCFATSDRHNGHCRPGGLLNFNTVLFSSKAKIKDLKFKTNLFLLRMKDGFDRTISKYSENRLENSYKPRDIVACWGLAPWLCRGKEPPAAFFSRPERIVYSRTLPCKKIMFTQNMCFLFTKAFWLKNRKDYLILFNGLAWVALINSYIWIVLRK